MAGPSADVFLETVRKSGIVDDKRLAAYVDKLKGAEGLPADPGKLAGLMVRDALLTKFQAEQLLAGKWRGFNIGKYRVLERLGSGGMGSVYLCEHKVMRRRVAIKVLPTSKAEDPSSLERFYREARAVAALDHPNIVRAYDIDQDEKLHFLVMEYVDGASLQDIIKKTGQMNPVRAAHYVRQASLGLQHAHEAGLVHRDIKPGNVLVDRNGTVKVLDMGLARFFHDKDDDITKKYDENVLGTADYLAPEQALDSHAVDIRADVYSLGCTFYFTLTGRSPFGEGTVTQKLIWHQTRQPKPLKELRAEIPDALVSVIQKMMAKDPAQRYQTPQEVTQALEEWTREPIAAPPDEEMPKLSPAASGAAETKTSTSDPALRPKPAPPSGPASPPPRTAPARSAAPAGSGSRSGSSVLSGATKPTSNGGTSARQPLSAGKGPSGPSSVKKAASAPALAEAAPTEAATIAPAASEENPFPWLSAADTAGPAAQGNDTVASVSRSLSPRAVLGIGAGRKLTRKQMLIIGGIAAGGLLVVTLVVLGVIAMLSSDPLNTAYAPPEDGSAAKTLYVSRAGEKDYHTITEALRAANPGDKIVVRDREIYEEPLLLSSKGLAKKEITIEAASGAVLQPTAQHNPKEPLITIEGGKEGIKEIKLKGFTLDGLGKLEELIKISGACPGLVLENVRLKGFKRTAINLAGCRGETGRWIQLQSLQFELPNDVIQEKAQPGPTAIGFTFGGNQFIQVKQCDFTGPFEAAIRLQAHVADCIVERNVFFGAGNLKDGAKVVPKNGILYTTNPAKEIHLLIGVQFLNNTFVSFQRGVCFRDKPDFKSNLEFTNNLFYQINDGVGMIEGPSPDLNYFAIICKGDYNVYDQKGMAGSKQGNLPLGGGPKDFTLPTASRDAPDFLRFKKDSPLATAGKDRKPVGAKDPLP